MSLPRSVSGAERRRLHALDSTVSSLVSIGTALLLTGRALQFVGKTVDWISQFGWSGQPRNSPQVYAALVWSINPNAEPQLILTDTWMEFAYTR